MFQLIMWVAYYISINQRYGYPEVNILLPIFALCNFNNKLICRMSEEHLVQIIGVQRMGYATRNGKNSNMKKKLQIYVMDRGSNKSWTFYQEDSIQKILAFCVVNTQVADILSRCVSGKHFTADNSFFLLRHVKIKNQTNISIRVN